MAGRDKLSFPLHVGHIIIDVGVRGDGDDIDMVDGSEE